MILYDSRKMTPQLNIMFLLAINSTLLHCKIYVRSGDYSKEVFVLTYFLWLNVCKCFQK